MNKDQEGKECKQRYDYGKSFDQVDPGFYIYRCWDSIVILEPEDLDHLFEDDVEIIVGILNGGD